MTGSVAPEDGRIRLRLHKGDKLRFKSQFDQARREGIKYVASGIVLIAAPAPEGKRECGVICSKKYSLLSVVRNRARRLLWESFRMVKPDLSPCRILLIPRRKMMEYDRERVTAELVGLLKKHGVLTGKNIL